MLLCKMDKVKNIKRSGGFRRKVQRILKNNLVEFPPSFHCGAEVNNPDGPSTSGSVRQTQQSSKSFSPAATVQQHFCTEALIESDVSFGFLGKRCRHIAAVILRTQKDGRLYGDDMWKVPRPF